MSNSPCCRFPVNENTGTTHVQIEGGPGDAMESRVEKPQSGFRSNRRGAFGMAQVNEFLAVETVYLSQKSQTQKRP
jgi:hypothetical protein